MNKMVFYSVFAVSLLLLFTMGAPAEMQSDNYSISTSVISGGGTPMGSTNYLTDSTLGQPTPAMEGDQNPFSDNYDNYPGFWYTVAVEPVDACEGNFDKDGDVDGSDLAVFAADFGRTDCDHGDPCEGDFDGDNDVDGSDLAVFAADFGRTDCP